MEFNDLKSQYRALCISINERIQRVLDNGHYIMGPEVKELEQALAAITGSRNCITVSSGTEALLISLMALNLKPGDEVITSPFTFAATAEVIVLLGGKPVFVDIDPRTCNIDHELIESAITERTRAIMPVSLYGQVADMDEINNIAARHGNLPVIEDAAQSFGAKYKGRSSCNLSTIGCTSFFPSKPLGCYGDGGAIFTNDDDLANACREIRIHGQSARYTHTRVGVGGRMDSLQCAVVLAKLEKFSWEIEQRTKIGERYGNLIQNRLEQSTRIDNNMIEGLLSVEEFKENHQNQKAETFKKILVELRPDRSSVFAQYTIFCNDRIKIQSRLTKAGIPSVIHYPIPLNEQPAYIHLCCGDCTPNAKKIAHKVLSLPMSAYLTEEQQNNIVDALFDYSS